MTRGPVPVGDKAQRDKRQRATGSQNSNDSSTSQVDRTATPDSMTPVRGCEIYFDWRAPGSHCRPDGVDGTSG
jgi:hypothetical protein